MDEAAEFREQLSAVLNSKIADLTPEIVDGRKVYMVRCRSGEMRARLPFRFSGGSIPPPVPVEASAPAEVDVRAVEPAKTSDLMIKGTASSTSEDWYGTEMSAPCLMDMAAQFGRGVGLFPSHGTWSRPLEWDDQMGTTVKAMVEQSDVAAQSDTSEPGYKLGIEGKLDPEVPLCMRLAKRLDNGQPIGLSIGGWFLEIRYIMDEDNEDIDRIIVERVELDHLAIVRNPANPDCADLQIMRSVAGAAVKERARRDLPTIQPPEPASAQVPPEPPVVNNRTEPTIAPPLGAGEHVEDVRTTQEIEMTAEEIQAAIQAGIERGVAAIRASLAPVAETTEQELVRLRAENVALTRARSQPNRNGGRAGARGIPDGNINPQSYEGLFGRAKELMGEDAALVDVVKRNMPSINLSSRARGEKGKEYRTFTESAPGLLTELCEAAEEDGLIGDMQRGWVL